MDINCTVKSVTPLNLWICDPKRMKYDLYNFSNTTSVTTLSKTNETDISPGRAWCQLANVSMLTCFTKMVSMASIPAKRAQTWRVRVLDGGSCLQTSLTHTLICYTGGVLFWNSTAGEQQRGARPRCLFLQFASLLLTTVVLRFAFAFFLPPFKAFLHLFKESLKEFFCDKVHLKSLELKLFNFPTYSLEGPQRWKPYKYISKCIISD